MADDNNDPSVQGGSYLDGSYFTDGAELTHSLVDTRSTDQLMASSFADAQELVRQFASNANSGAWSSSLRRAEVAQRLYDLVTVTDPNLTDPVPANGPRSLQQGALNLCGPTAFFQMALGRDPVAVIRCAIDLYETGCGSIGSLQISPSASLLQADFDAMLQIATNAGRSGFTAAEWMLLGALRNSTDVFWQGTWTGNPDQELSAMTRPEELAGWMRSSGIWSRVEDNGRWATNPGVVAATDIVMYRGLDVAFLVHANLIARSELYDPNTGEPEDPATPQVNPAKPDDTFLLSSFPDHWIVLLNEVTPTADQTAVQLSVWTWGRRLYLRTPTRVFLDNYYGSVIGHFPDPAQVN